MKMPPIAAEIIIEAAPEVVWRVLLDLDRYPEWNRFTPHLSLRSDELVVGAELDLDCQMSARTYLENEREVILAIDEKQLAFCMGTSRTRGRPGIRSERWQRCELRTPRQTHFRNCEVFSGPLAPLVYLLYAGRLRRAFEQYCRDLKARAESLVGLA